MLIILGLLSATLAVSIYWTYQYMIDEESRQKVQSQLVAAQEQGTQYQEALQALKDGSPDAFLTLCEQNGVTAQEVMQTLAAATQTDAPAAVDAFSDATSPYADDVVEGGASEGTVVTTVSQPNAAQNSAYAQIQPDLRVTPPSQNVYAPKSVYLTFDGDVNANGNKLLDILKENNVKASFFVNPAQDGSDAAQLKRIVSEGHTLGVRLSTNYSKTYASVEAYLNAFAEASNRIEQATGIKPDVFRFPGGSLNDYNTAISQDLIEEMLSRGYRYFDWNVDSGETTSINHTEKSMRDNTISAIRHCDRAIVLMYNELYANATVKSLSSIITQMQSEGYTFYKLTHDVQPMVFKAK